MHRLFTFGVVAFAAMLFGAADAFAVEPNQVTGLTAVQRDGFTTLAWDVVPGATDYQIERTPVDAANVATGSSVIVGVWQPVRTVTPGSPRFAEAGYALGGRFQWRVRARIGTTPQPYSEPVFGTTLPQWGTGPGAGLRTQWESSGNATYTSDVNEYAYEAALDAASDRIRVVELGRTNPVASGPASPGNRPINMLILGYPSPPATAQAISGSPAIVYNCNVHGNEPQGRESCLIFARMLAFTEDPHLLEVLANTTVLLVPAINGNGRAANTRGNETGADLNRDHAGIEQPETKAFAEMLRDYTPEVGIDLHEGDSEDLPILSARHLNVFEPLFDEGKDGLIEGWMYDNAALSGWWAGPYSTGGDSHEGILRNTFGLKNTVGMLAENRASGGPTRPAEGPNLANRNRKSYGSLWEEFQTLEYYWVRRAQIHAAVEGSIAFNVSNTGPAVLRGAYPWPADLRFPPHGLPDVDALSPENKIDPPPCGYFLTEAQYSGPLEGGTVGLRLGLHGIAQETRPAGHIVRLIQPLRGLIPTLLDPAAVSPEPIIGGTRLSECPFVTAAPRTFSLAATEGTEKTVPLTIGNEAVEVDEPLDWTITEAPFDCSAPSDVSWLSVDVTEGTTASAGGSSTVSVTASTTGAVAPDVRAALLCLTSNDSGEPLIALPVQLQVEYPFTGFLKPLDNPPALNDVAAGAAVPVRFALAGDRGLEVLDGPATSHQVECTTKAALSTPSPIATTGSSGLVYDAAEGTYRLGWKTVNVWSASCRQLTVTLDDATEHIAYVRFH